MKRVFASVLLVCLLVGCKNPVSQTERALSLRQRLSQSAGCRFVCQITADYYDCIYSFHIRCEMDAEGAIRFEVMQPDTIAGICGIIDQKGGDLTFDDQLLAFPLLADGYLSPVSTPWLMVKALRKGYIESCCQDTDGLRVTIRDTYADALMMVEVWLSKQDTPFYCEILWEGRRILSMSVTDFVIL